MAVGKNNWLGSSGEDGLGLGLSSDVWMFSGVRYKVDKITFQAETIYGRSNVKGSEEQLIREADIALAGWSVAGQMRLTNNSQLSLKLKKPPHARNGKMAIAGLAQDPDGLTEVTIKSQEPQNHLQMGCNHKISNIIDLSVTHKVVGD